MKSDNNKYLFFIILGFCVFLSGINKLHFLPLENQMYSFSYTLGNNSGKIARVLLGLVFMTKGILFFKKTRIR